MLNAAEKVNLHASLKNNLDAILNEDAEVWDFVCLFII